MEIEKFIYLHAFENNFISSACNTVVTIIFLQINLKSALDIDIDLLDNPEIIWGSLGSSSIANPCTTLSGQYEICLNFFPNIFTILLQDPG